MEDDSISGMNNPIFRIMSPKYKNDPIFFPKIQPALFPPSSYLSDLKYNYSFELDKFSQSLKDFNKNILQMMQTTNKMIEIIDQNSDINLNFSYKNNSYIIKCKLNDKLSDVIKKIKIDEEGFDINKKIFIFCGLILNLNAKVKDEGLKNFDFILITDN